MRALPLAAQGGSEREAARTLRLDRARPKFRAGPMRFSKMSPLEVWYERLDMQTLIENAPDAKTKKVRMDMSAKAHERITIVRAARISA